MNRMTQLMAVATTGALLWVGCGDSGGSKSAPASSAKVEKAAAAAAKPAEKKGASVPHPPKTGVKPASSGPHDPKKGEVVYGQYCSNCHGPRGAGDGPVGMALTPKPARHDDGDYMNALSNDYLFKVIKAGGAAVGKSPLMASWGGSLSDEEIWHTVAFVRSLAEPAYDGPKP